MSSNSADAGVSPKTKAEIAFIADVHLHDVYGHIDGFDGLRNSKSQQNAIIRTMYSQLTSTRLFNENYFAFRAALDDILRRGVRLVALPGDYTDDAQPINIDGLRTILEEYEAKGLRFYLSPGNHDPNEPFDDEGGKDDFLGLGGREQRIYSPQSEPCREESSTNPDFSRLPQSNDLVCAEQIRELGYASTMERLAAFGYMPQPDDLYWESPFSPREEKRSYSYEVAKQEAALSNRHFEICHEGAGGAYKQADYTSCSTMIDASYVVEPVEGVWLLSIDANVYRPKAKEAFDASQVEKASNYSGSGDAGYDFVRSHKTHLLPWIASVVKRAKAQGKQLIAFSHFPLAEFYNGQSDRMSALFKPKAFQMIRRPNPKTTEAFAATGLNLHVAGHMHMNNTGVYPPAGQVDPGGHFLVNIQSPSLAVFGASYKLLSLRDNKTVEVETVALDEVPRFNELFEHYDTEWERLNGSAELSDKNKLWKRDILTTANYYDYTRFYFGELSRLRFLKDYWPCLLKEVVTQFNGAQLLALSQLQTDVSLSQLTAVPDVMPLSAACAAEKSPLRVEAQALKQDWAKAQRSAEQLATRAGLDIADFTALSPYEFYGDFHRSVYAGQLSMRRMNARRLKVYSLLFESFAAASSTTVQSPSARLKSISEELRPSLQELFKIYEALLQGTPSDHFVIDFDAQTVSSLSKQKDVR